MTTRKKIVVTGGSGRFAKILKKTKSIYNFIYPTKKQLNITNYNSIKKYLKKTKPKMLLHLAGLSRPMALHEKNINRSINLNIIGTSNIVNACSELNIKVIYFSTSYVYPGKRGNYNERDPLLPWNNYAWSKLGGECAVQMYKNSLILRVCMTERPFIHKRAFANVKLNFIFHDELINMFFKIINKKGVINIGGQTRSVYQFARKYNKNVKKLFNKQNNKNSFPPNPSMSIKKLRNFTK